MDRSIERLIQTLEEHGIDDNTLIVFASDNGAQWGSNYPLCGRRWDGLEGGVRVPLIIWSKELAASEQSGAVLDGLVSLADIAPTLVEHATGGYTLPTDGINLIPYLMKEKPWPPDREYLITNAAWPGQNNDYAGNPISNGGRIWFRLNPGRAPRSGRDFGIERYNTVADSGILTLTEAPATETKAFADWAQARIPEGLDRSFGGSAVGDGVANGVKFAFGLDPMASARADELVSTGKDEEGRMQITYRVDTDAGGISVKPEVSLGLVSGGWFREQHPVEGVPYVRISEGTLIEGGIYEFTATAMNVDAAGAVFMRVAVETGQFLE